MTGKITGSSSLFTSNSWASCVSTARADSLDIRLERLSLDSMLELDELA